MTLHTGISVDPVSYRVPDRLDIRRTATEEVWGERRQAGRLERPSTYPAT